MTTFSHGFWAYVLTRNRTGFWYIILGAVFSDFVFIFGFVSLIIFNPNYNLSFLKASHLEILNRLLAIPTVEFLNKFLHSIFVWGTFFILSFFISKKVFFPFVIGWGIHIWQDILTHVIDADRNLWPVSSLKIKSLISYWDPSHFGREFRVVNWLLITAISLWFYRERKKVKKVN